MRFSFLKKAEIHKKYEQLHGKIGYIKKKKLSDPETLREELLESNMEINVLEESADISQNYERLKTQENKDNVVILEDFILKKEAKIEATMDTQSENYQKFFQSMNTNNIGIFAKLKSEATVSATFATYTQRNQMINDLYNQVISKQYQGICIDFEQIDDVNSFYRFLIELTPKFKESGLKVVVKLNGQIKKERIKNIVNLIIK